MSYFTNARVFVSKVMVFSALSSLTVSMGQHLSYGMMVSGLEQAEKTIRLAEQMGGPICHYDSVFKNGRNSAGSGVLIRTSSNANRGMILTSAHTLFDKDVSSPLTSVMITFAVNPEEDRRFFFASGYAIHPRYIPGSHPDDDLALIEFEIPQGVSLPTMNLPDQAFDFSSLKQKQRFFIGGSGEFGINGISTSWDASSGYGNMKRVAPVLAQLLEANQASVRKRDSFEATYYLASLQDYLKSEKGFPYFTLPLNDPSLARTTHGDSGGPLFLFNTEQKQATVFGVMGTVEYQWNFQFSDQGELLDNRNQQILTTSWTALTPQYLEWIISQSLDQAGFQKLESSSAAVEIVAKEREEWVALNETYVLNLSQFSKQAFLAFSDLWKQFCAQKKFSGPYSPSALAYLSDLKKQAEKEDIEYLIEKQFKRKQANSPKPKPFKGPVSEEFIEQE